MTKRLRAVALPRPILYLADGPVEICISSDGIYISTLSGPLIHIFETRQVVINYRDHDRTEIFGDTSQPRSN